MRPAVVRTKAGCVLRQRAAGVAAALAATATASPLAAADPAVLLASRWPGVPDNRGLTLEQQITDRLTDIGNVLGRHLDLLSHDLFQLSVDGRRRHAHIRFGGGDDQLLSLRVDSDVQFDQLNARIDARIDLGFHGHVLRLVLPSMDMSPAEYHGDYGVQIKVPLFVQRF
jgi:hypothetical protein